MLADMIVNRFTTLDQLDALRSRWAELYRLDPHSNLFLSWDWLYACLASEKRPWIILGVRRGEAPYLAFLPLSFARHPRLGSPFHRELRLGPGPRADFTGLLGLPGEEAHFIPALAREIELLPWDSLTLANCADGRVVSLVAEFSSSRYRFVAADSTPTPFVKLPSTWDSYLATRGPATRATLRKHLRRIERLPGYRLHFAQPSEAESAIEDLLRLHSARWKQSFQKWHRLFGEFFAKCYASGRFAVCAIYQGTTLVAAQGFFIDTPQRRIVAYMIAHNPEYSRFSPGTMLMCASIRHAIEHGYESYSFSLGAQPYKVSFATDVAYITNAKLWRRSVRASARFRGGQAIKAAKGFARKLLLPGRRAHAGLLVEG
jgi:CelD/BcsL family acetyltransferase involved in cellulose biosynthesis